MGPRTQMAMKMAYTHRGDPNHLFTYWDDAQKYQFINKGEWIRLRSHDKWPSKWVTEVLTIAGVFKGSFNFYNKTWGFIVQFDDHMFQMS